MTFSERPSCICFLLWSVTSLWVIIGCVPLSTNAAPSTAPLMLENSVLSSLTLTGPDPWKEPAEKEATRYAKSQVWRENIQRIPNSEFFAEMARIPWKQLAEQHTALRNNKRALGIEIPDMFINAKSPAAHSHSKSSLSMGIDLGGMRKLAAKLRGMGKFVNNANFTNSANPHDEPTLIDQAFLHRLRLLHREYYPSACSTLFGIFKTASGNIIMSTNELLQVNSHISSL